MTLQEIAQLAGVVGVIASFFFVAVQIRYNTRAVSAASFQNLVTSFASQLDELARSRELCELALRGGDDFESLDRIDRARFRFHVLGFLRRAENAYFQVKVGTLRDENWFGFRESIAAILEGPGGQACWQIIRNRINPAFRAVVDEILLKKQAAA